MSALEGLIERLEQLTSETYRKLDEAGYEELAALAGQRDELVAAISRESVSLADKKRFMPRIQAVLKQDEDIKSKISWFMMDAQQGMNKINNGQKSRAAYDAPYTLDSIFFNKRR